MATTLYCTQSDVENRLSADGVTYRSDDAPPTSLGDVLDDASRLIDEYCLPSYSEANLAVSPWVKHRTADVAAYLLCERRGNPVPPGIAAKFERLLKSLERVQLGRLQIPDIPRRRASAPVLSNVRVKLAPAPHTVVERGRNPSRNLPEDYVQRADPLDYVYDWTI